MSALLCLPSLHLLMCLYPTLTVFLAGLLPERLFGFFWSVFLSVANFPLLCLQPAVVSIKARIPSVLVFFWLLTSSHFICQDREGHPPVPPGLQLRDSVGSVTPKRVCLGRVPKHEADRVNQEPSCHHHTVHRQTRMGKTGRGWVARWASRGRQDAILTPEVLSSRGKPQAQLKVLGRTSLVPRWQDGGGAHNKVSAKLCRALNAG